jgi:hypothetical protein
MELTSEDTMGKKRKRVDSLVPNQRASASQSISNESRDSSEEYNTAAAQTRSGRQIQKRPTLLGVVAASPSTKQVSNSPRKAATASSVPIKSHPKIKRRVYRGREQFALCEHCLRGHGPAGNVIVFCDACNKCWHQRCHEPQISKQTVSDTKAEWYCAECDKILHGSKKGKKNDTKITPLVVATPPPVAAPVPPHYAGPRVGGRYLQMEQKMDYLKTLTKDKLITLLLDASHLAPDLPMFETLVQPTPTTIVPEAQFTSTYVTPVSSIPVANGDADAANMADAVDEGYDGYYDEHAALYPKPGFGIQLPPESEDMHMLLEGKDSRTFSHWVKGMKGREFSGTGNIAI